MHCHRNLVEIDYRDKQGNRSVRAIEAYSLRRSKAGDVLLMAVRADNGQSRSYLVESILGVTPTQVTFSPRYPIELTPSGPQYIPHTSSSGSTFEGSFTKQQAPSVGRTPFRGISSSKGPRASGPIYVFRCPVCSKTFSRQSYDASARPHKNKTGFDCYGTYLIYVKTKF